MECAVIALKAKGDKNGIKAVAYQVAQLTTRAVKCGIQIVECVVTFGGVKDILREIRGLDSQKRFNTLLIYSPNQFCKDETEFRAFVEILEKDFKVQVRYIRSNF